jgi:hypothetical protein
MKTSELRGTALDWAVAKCEGLNTYIEVVEGFKPSTDWALGGPIIERERLQLSPGLAHDEHRWSAVRYDYLFDDDLDCFMGGATPLIAAMRCYVASKLGNEVQIPEELSAHATPPEG